MQKVRGRRGTGEGMQSGPCLVFWEKSSRVSSVTNNAPSPSTYCAKANRAVPSFGVRAQGGTKDRRSFSFLYLVLSMPPKEQSMVCE